MTFPHKRGTIASSLGHRTNERPGMRTLRLVCILTMACPLAVLPNLANGASFDCSKATSKAEVLVCQNPELSALDDKLSELYSSVKKQSSNSRQLVLDQRAWMARRNACQTVECISSAYEARLLELAGSTTTPEFTALIGKVVRGRCHMDTCSWFSIESMEPAGQSGRGQLFKMTLKWWESYHPGGSYDRRAPRQGEESATSFIFCSKTVPALIDKDDRGSGWSATMLAPGNSDAIFGATETALTLYWAACHGKAVEDVYKGGERLGKEFGYQVKWPVDSDGIVEPPDNKALQQPTDALKW